MKEKLRKLFLGLFFPFFHLGKKDFLTFTWVTSLILWKRVKWVTLFRQDLFNELKKNQKSIGKLARCCLKTLRYHEFGPDIYLQAVYSSILSREMLQNLLLFWNKTNIFLQPRVKYLFSLLGLPITFATIVFSIARICRKSKEMSVTWQKLWPFVLICYYRYTFFVKSQHS